jgi:hypothetical protein
MLTSTSTRSASTPCTVLRRERGEHLNTSKQIALLEYSKADLWRIRRLQITFSDFRPDFPLDLHKWIERRPVALFPGVRELNVVWVWAGMCGLSRPVWFEPDTASILARQRPTLRLKGQDLVWRIWRRRGETVGRLPFRVSILWSDCTRARESMD